MRMKTIFVLFVSSLLVALQAAAAQQGELPYVPVELLDETVRIQGDSVRVCVYDDIGTTDFDVAASALVADALILGHEIKKITANFGLFEDGDLFYSIYLNLVNNCDMIAGFSLTDVELPDWLAVTRSYVAAPFVLLSAEPERESLTDIPRGAAVGTQVGSHADMTLLAYNSNLRPEERWHRFPYGSDELMLERLDDGTIEAALLWYPNLRQVRSQWQETYRLLSTEPLPEPTAEVGFITFNNQDWLLSQLDAAIAELLDTGELVTLAQEHGIIPGDDME